MDWYRDLCNQAVDYDDDGSVAPESIDDEPELEDFLASPGCPYCNLSVASAVYLGKLGRLDWFRCRNCGAEYHTED